MLDERPVAVLTPWTRGGHLLPGPKDVDRLCDLTADAYCTARLQRSRRTVRRGAMVDKTIRESAIRLRPRSFSEGMIRLRCRLGSGGDWRVETLGSACRLRDVYRTSPWIG